LSAVLAVLLSAAGPQEAAFESAEYGIRLKIPRGWTVDATKTPRVILKLTLPGEHAFPPEILLSELAFSEYVTLAQYREQVRQFIQRTYREPRLLDDRDCAAGGRPGFYFVTASKTLNDAEAVSFKGFIALQPARMLSVECVYPKAGQEDAQKAYDGLLAAIEFIPRKPPPGTEEGLKRFAEEAAKLAAPEPGLTRKEELEYVLGERNIGTYTLEIAASSREGVEGLEQKSAHVVDLGEEGRAESRVTGFLSNDLARQWVQVEDARTGKDRRTQYFTAKASLEGGQMTVERRINGEKSSVQVKVPERTVFSELVEALQARLVPGAKVQLSVPAISAFENEAGHVRIHLEGRHEMRVDDKLVEVHVVSLQRDETLLNYWYSADRRILRRTVSGQSLVLRPKK
jgi:hypothetical protein